MRRKKIFIDDLYTRNEISAVDSYDGRSEKYTNSHFVCVCACLCVCEVDSGEV